MSTQFVSRELIRAGFVRALRTVFESNQDFRYEVDPANPNETSPSSGIFIYDAWPWKRISYPAVIVTLGPADPLLRTIGGEHRFDTTTDFESTVDGLTHSNIDKETFGGGIQTTVRIHVYARSAIQRSQVMDQVVMYLRHFFVDIFQQQGVTVADMKHDSETMVLVDTQPVYGDALSVVVYSEFERSISTELAGTIRALSLTNVFTYLPNGSTDSQILN